jgi:hypothetical protein
MVASLTFPSPNGFLYLRHARSILSKIMLCQVIFYLTSYIIYDNILSSSRDSGGEAMSEREQKALVIAATKKIKQISGVWLVPSQSVQRAYRVDPNPEFPTCTCPDFELRHARCKHIYAVELVIKREQTITQTTEGDTTTTTVTETVTATKRVTYRQNWPAYNAAQTNEKNLFLALLHDLCKQHVPEIEQSGPNSGRKRLPLRDMIFAATFKVFSTVSGRRFIRNSLINTPLCYDSPHGE